MRRRPGKGGLAPIPAQDRDPDLLRRGGGRRAEIGMRYGFSVLPSGTDP